MNHRFPPMCPCHHIDGNLTRYCAGCHGKLFAGEVYYDILGESFCDGCAAVAARRTLHRFRRQMPFEVMK